MCLQVPSTTRTWCRRSCRGRVRAASACHRRQSIRPRTQRPSSSRTTITANGSIRSAPLSGRSSSSTMRSTVHALRPRTTNATLPRSPTMKSAGCRKSIERLAFWAPCARTCPTIRRNSVDSYVQSVRMKKRQTCRLTVNSLAFPGKPSPASWRAVSNTSTSTCRPSSPKPT